jgi:hypothetical protein
MDEKLFVENAEMGRDEWYKTPDFIVLRFLNNIAVDINHRAQQLRDVLQLLLAHRPDLAVRDKFALVERQLRIVSLEADRLYAECRNLGEVLTPKMKP